MLSSESLLLALNSGCLNSQAYRNQHGCFVPWQDLHLITYTRTIWRLSAVLVVVSHLVKIIFIELSDEACKVAVFEVFGQDRFGESFILRRVFLSAVGFPAFPWF